MATRKTKIKLQNATEVNCERLYNEDLASVRERTWRGYCIFTVGGEVLRRNTGRLRDGVYAAGGNVSGVRPLVASQQPSAGGKEN